MNPTVDLLRAVLALTFVLGLIWLLGLFIRKYGWKWGMPTPMARSAVKRLRLVEVMPLDGKNKIVLIQRDKVEHLILVGNQDVRLIETIPDIGNANSGADRS